MKDVLVHVRDFQQYTAAAQFGVRLAVACGAGVTGMYTCPRPVYIAPEFERELMTAAIESERRLVTDAVEAGPSFVDWVASLGAKRARWWVAEGGTVDALAQAAARHDVLVLEHATAERGSAWDVPRVILKADAPCIVVPHHGVPYRAFERIAIGWNGSPESMRAVHAALPFLSGKRVVLMRGEEREPHSRVEWHPPFDIAQYLRDRDVTVVSRAITARPADVGASLLEEAMQFRANLLVMGAYGRSRFSEWMLGGATRDVLTWADIPVLLRH